MAEVWAGLAPEERLDLKLLSLLEHDLDGDDMRLLSQLARRRLDETRALVDEVQAALRSKDVRIAALSGTLDSVWGWLVLRRRELHDVERKLDELRDQSTAVATALRERRAELEAAIARRNQQRDRLLKQIGGFKVTTPYKDIARLKGSTVGTVCSRLFRLRERLARPLSRRGGSAMTHLDVMTLSQLLDGELEHAGPAEAHLASCPACGTRLARVRDADAAVRAAGNAAGPRAAAAAPPVRRRVGWSAGSMRPRRPPSVRRWAGIWTRATSASATSWRRRGSCGGSTRRRCRRCLTRCWRASPRSGRPRAGPVPTTVVVELARRSVRLVERHLVAPIADLVEVAAPAVAVRAGAELATLQFELRADGACIRTTVVSAGDAVDVTIMVAGASGEPLPAHRVSLRRHGRALFSARTDADGRIVLPALERGVYEVSCPGVATAFRLDLRAAD